MEKDSLINLPDEDVYATRKKIEFILNNIASYQKNINEKIKVFDYGCGNAEQLGQYVIEKGYDYVGYDMHEPSLVYAENNFRASNVKFTRDFPENKKFNVILLSEVLEHLDDPLKNLINISNILTNKGIILGSVPNGYGLTEIEKYIDKKLGLYKNIQKIYRQYKNKEAISNTEKIDIPYNHASGHVQFFTTSSLNKVFQDSGFRLKLLKNGSVMGADLSGSTFLKHRRIIDLNTRIANYIPSFSAATWHFLAVKN